MVLGIWHPIAWRGSLLMALLSWPMRSVADIVKSTGTVTRPCKHTYHIFVFLLTELIFSCYNLFGEFLHALFFPSQIIWICTLYMAPFLKSLSSLLIGSWPFFWWWMKWITGWKRMPCDCQTRKKKIHIRVNPETALKTHTRAYVSRTPFSESSEIIAHTP